ncbi:DUF924 family protein [Shewanella sp. WPAGA9]|uniref:DUF924 family protein n=1 Tax=Shewanella sp. ENK2 TaxID=2775245 RepID=UPI0017806410|nr:DUF924 family protein [Shewanella sp. WPAGA9]
MSNCIISHELNGDAANIIQFWFTDIDSDLWFTKDKGFDATIKQQFNHFHRQAIAGELFHWRNTALGRLAEIIVLDQFSRNLYRDSSKAFASDSLALVLAQEAIHCGDDKRLKPTERSFLYMPFMHSESLSIHQQALTLFKQDGLESNYQFELKHLEIIERFGRYPHRNMLLGRESTEEELRFLEQPGSGF